MENLCAFVSSRGIAKACDVRNARLISGSDHLKFDDFSDSRLKADEFVSIYLCTNSIQSFFDQYYDSLPSQFTLVTGDSDQPLSEAFLDRFGFYKILIEDVRLKAWYAQNLSAKHEKLKFLPIGLDLHTVWERPGIYEKETSSPLKQQSDLFNILSKSKCNQERLFGAYCDWCLSCDRGDRIECLTQIDRSFCVFETKRLERTKCWENQSKFCFIVSPEGVGVDCHRTWEAIALGVIPIIKKNPITSIFDDLPVIIVDHWSEVNKENILNCYSKLYTKKFNYEKLFLEFWRSAVNWRNRNIRDSRFENKDFFKLTISEYLNLYK